MRRRVHYIEMRGGKYLSRYAKVHYFHFWKIQRGTRLGESRELSLGLTKVCGLLWRTGGGSLNGGSIWDVWQGCREFSLVTGNFTLICLGAMLPDVADECLRLNCDCGHTKRLLNCFQKSFQK